MPLVNRTRVNSTCDKELMADLKELSKTTRLQMSVLLDEAIADLLKKYNFKNKELKR